MNRHEMTGPDRDGDITVVGCTCGQWHRRWHAPFTPIVREAESDHEAHRQHAGAAELRDGTTPRTTSLDDLVAITRALTDAAAAGVKAMEALQEFAAAHAKATTAGHGVLVVRQPDGSITSTPSIYLAAGTAVFMDAPGPLVLPPIQFTPEPASGGRIPGRDHLDYLPRYTVAPGRPMFTHPS